MRIRRSFNKLSSPERVAFLIHIIALDIYDRSKVPLPVIDLSGSLRFDDITSHHSISMDGRI
jgi:hypothetical protein